MVEWNFFDRDVETDIRCRDRPHWDQAGALTFVTFRLADSMPKAVLQRWQQEQQQWLESRELRTDLLREGLEHANLPASMRKQLLKFRNQRWHENLDNCHGSCALGHPEVAQLVVESLLKFNGDRYDLERFVIMPNHVHLLVQMRAGWQLRKQCESWLRFTGRAINATLGRRGAFWKTEPFDHIVRSESQFRYLQQYLADNPTKAHLKAGQFILWICRQPADA